MNYSLDHLFTLDNVTSVGRLLDSVHGPDVWRNEFTEHAATCWCHEPRDIGNPPF